jgi:uncharacterized protein
MDAAHIKLEKLKDMLGQLGKVAVAYSGGVDSTFLLAAARQIPGEDVMAITARSNLFPGKETDEAAAFAFANNICHTTVDVNELEVDGFAGNPDNRCYLCKKNLFGRFRKIAGENGFIHLAEGSNIDDDGDYRPGHAAIKELGILSPLREAGLAKNEIRQLSREMGLPTWSKPSFACLASRIPYGETITPDKLKAVEISEQVLFGLGFKQARVRHHGSLARIEVAPEDIGRLLQPAIRDSVYSGLKKAGFIYVAADLHGYRMGSMNQLIGK